MSVGEKLAEHGIQPRSLGQGDQKLTCPRCSEQRRNKTDPCLSLKIDDRGAAWHCHHCDWSDGFVLHDERRQIPRHDPAPRRELKPLPGHPGSLSAEALAWFVGERGISEETLKIAKVGWSERRGAVVFPFHAPGIGQVGVKLRWLPKAGFEQSKGGCDTYWLIDQANSAISKDLYIVEGEMDALAMLEAGIRNVVSVPSGGGKKRMPFIETCEEWVKPFERIILALDGDEKGQAMQDELARCYGKDICWQIKWPADCPDANAFLQTYGKAELEAHCRSPEPYPVEGVFGVSDYRQEVLKLYFDGNRQKGHSTGLKSVDEFYTIVPGQLTVLTGVPNHGKSEFIDQVMVNLAKKEGWSFGVCSFENTPEEHIAKWAEKWLAMPFRDGPTPRMTSFNLEHALDEIGQHFHFIRSESDEAPTIDWILDRARVLVRRYAIRGLVIDPYNEVEHRRPDNMSETEYVSSLLSKLKRFCQNHGVHGWFVAHPAKMRTEGGKTPVPTLYDISGSAHFVNKADVGVVVHRGEQKGTAEIWIRKCRFKWVGQQGKAVLGYKQATGIYSDLGVR